MEIKDYNNITPVSLKFGYFKLNMNYIPIIFDDKKDKFVYSIEAGDYNRNNILRGDFYIKSSIDIIVNIGGCDYILDKGEYFFFRNLFMFHEFSIVTNTNNEDVIIYHDCGYDVYKEENYRYAMRSIIHDHSAILYNSLHSVEPNNKDNYVIATSGIIGDILKNELNKFSERNIHNLKLNSSWLHLRRNIEQQNIKIKLYYLSLSADIEKLYEIMDDKEVNDLLVNHDRGVTLTDPPILGIRFTETNHAALKELLDEKYGFNIYPIEKCILCNIRENVDYNKLVQDIINHNNEIERYENEGFYTYEIFKEIPFTYEFYEDLMTIFDENKSIQKYL